MVTPSVEVVPPMLSPRARTVPGIGGTWCAVRCRSRSEKQLAADMLDAGFDFFLPLVKRLDNRKRVSYSPLEYLRGLIFASSQDAPEPGYSVPTRLHYFLHDHAAFYGIIPVSTAAQRQFQNELEQIHFSIVTGEYREKENAFAVVGAICKVRDGAYQGQTVTVGRVLSLDEVEVDIATMGDVRPMRIAVSQLEAASAN